MTHRAAAAVLVFALSALAAPAAGQEAAGPDAAPAPELEAGDVATIVVQVPAPPSVDSARYQLQLEPGYRPFMPADGRVSRLDDLFLIPVSFATPGELPAGRLAAGTLRVWVGGSGSPVEREIAIRVRERRVVSFHLETDELGVAPDGVAAIPFRLHNRGNLPDTVLVDARAGEGWTLLATPRIVLEPGDSARGLVRIAAPESAAPGERALVQVSATAAAGQEVRTLGVVVVSSSGWLGNLAHVPSSIFVGQTLDGTSAPAVALSGGGRIAPDTDLRLELRHYEQGALDPVLQRQLAGARVRMAVSRPDLDLQVGDVYGFQSTLSASRRQGRGVRTEYDPAGPVSLRAMAALPTTLDGGTGGGHMLHTEANLETPYGDIGVVAGDEIQPGLGNQAEVRTTGGGLRWSGQRGPHEGSVEATVLGFTADDSLHRSGAAVDLNYAVLTERLTGRVRVRRVPGAVTARGGLGNEISGSFSGRVTPWLHVVGWGFDTDQRFLGNDARSASRTASVGVRGRFDGLQLQLSGTHGSRRIESATTAESGRETVRAEGTFALGTLSVQSDLEVGTSWDFGQRGGFRAVGGGARWSGRSGWAWLRLQHTDRTGSLTTTSLNLGGTAELDRVDLSGGLSSAWTAHGSTTSIWTGADVRANRHLTVHLGASARPLGDVNDWRLSVGFSRQLALPLPFARQPDLHGVVFDDANDNGVRDAEERVLPGVGLVLGHLETVSDDDGRFSFQDATGATLRVRTDRLPLGYVLSPRVLLAARGAVAVPVLRTATLHLDLFLDRDEDGVRDEAETHGAGVTVILTDEQGRQQTATADETGTVRASGLLPGHYSITATPAEADRAAGAEPQVLLDLDLPPGSEVHHVVPVPLRRRTIRMGGDPGFTFPR